MVARGPQPDSRLLSQRKPAWAPSQHSRMLVWTMTHGHGTESSSRLDGVSEGDQEGAMWRQKGHSRGRGQGRERGAGILVCREFNVAGVAHSLHPGLERP